MLRIKLEIIAPIPVGHHVTAIPLEHKQVIDFSGGENWLPTSTMIVCDDTTRIVYTARGVGSESMTYEALAFDPGSSLRMSNALAPIRGTVTSCVVRTDYGDGIRMETVLGVEPDPTGYR